MARDQERQASPTCCRGLCSLLAGNRITAYASIAVAVLHALLACVSVALGNVLALLGLCIAALTIASAFLLLSAIKSRGTFGVALWLVLACAAQTLRLVYVALMMSSSVTSFNYELSLSLLRVSQSVVYSVAIVSLVEFLVWFYAMYKAYHLYKLFQEEMRPPTTSSRSQPRPASVASIDMPPWPTPPPNAPTTSHHNVTAGMPVVKTPLTLAPLNLTMDTGRDTAGPSWQHDDNPPPYSSIAQSISP